MKRLLKWISVVLALVVVALVAVVVVVTSVIDPNQFKPVIIAQFKQFTGFEMTIPGKLSWSFYPHLGMEASEVVVSDSAVFNANLKNLVLRAKLAPLLHKQLDFSKVSISELQVNQLQASQVRAKIIFKDDVLTIQQINAELYQGALEADATVSLRQASPDLHIVGKLDQVDIAGLLKGLSGKTAKLQLNGRADARWDLTTQGKKTDELLSHLNGTGRLNVDKGFIKGIDLTFFVDTAAALINKEPLPTQASTGETAFGQLTATAVIKEGIVTTSDLTLDSPDYTVKAFGTVDLLNKTLDFHLNVTSKIEQKDNKLLALYGKTVPIQISGNLSDPSVALDTLALMKEIGKEQLQKVGQEIQKALPDKANSFIKSLFH